MSWVVLKFGGTSVSGVDNWPRIAQHLASIHAEGHRALVVCSALSQVTNHLEALLRTALTADPASELAWLRERHGRFAAELGVSAALVASDLDELERLASGIQLLGEASPRVRARVLASGERMSTRLVHAWLAARTPAAWMDARELLRSVDDDAPHRHYLSAFVPFDDDPALRERLEALPPVVLTQGFIAGDQKGDTVVLGRGGSDTSATTLAALLGAVRCEIWTDVPGMYTANPRQIPQARLLRRLDYDEAQELASSGAKVLHPRCLAPCRAAGVPLAIRSTPQPEAEGTLITGEPGTPRPKNISMRANITLLSMSSLGMWQQVGFAARVFTVLASHGLSVDLVATSESNLTVSLDPNANALDPQIIAEVRAELAQVCQVDVLHPCASVSLVGRGARSLLPQLGHALEPLGDHGVHLVSQAATDINLTFVVDERHGERLVERLHAALFPEDVVDPLLGPPLGGEPVHTEPVDARAWWLCKREQLLAMAQQTSPLYVYDRETLAGAARDLLGLENVDRIFYAMKANSHPDILRLFEGLGLGFECVSPGELSRVFSLFPDLDPKRVLYTPNFAPRRDYAAAVARGVNLTLDNLHPLSAWPELFAGREVLLRLDPGQGRGHHKHVRTAGAGSKFGIWPEMLDEVQERLAEVGATVVGLHAHTGSGIRTPDNWREAGAFLAQVARRFPAVRVLDLGGGLGIPERPGQAPLDLAAVDASLASVKAAAPDVELWMEPGRYLVARAGVLLTRVTQLKQKGAWAYVGVDTGMNSLIRPALYGAWHEIVNLSRWGEPLGMTATVVGPICESGDTLGRARRLPETVEGDVMLVGTAGAYGRAMSSEYNLRAPAKERLL